MQENSDGFLREKSLCRKNEQNCFQNLEFQNKQKNDTPNHLVYIYTYFRAELYQDVDRALIERFLKGC